MKNFYLLHPKDQIIATMERIYSHDMTTTSGGNISIRDDNGDVWMTPARVDKGTLKREDIVCIHPDGSIDGLHPPSSEAPFHLGIYRVRSDINAIIHAHPGALVSFSICGTVPDTRVFPKAYNTCGKVAFAPYALPGSEKLGDQIAREFASSAQPSCVVLENHGVVCGGSDLALTFSIFETLEFTALTIINASRLGPVEYLDTAVIERCQNNQIDLPEAPSINPSSREKELRKEICDFIHRAYMHRLMTSTWGSFSARINAESFVITPTHLDREQISVEDLIVIRNGRADARSRPSRAVRVHAAIYAAHPEIQAVVNALPVHATAFSISERKLDTRTIPESYLFLKDVDKVPFAAQFAEVESIAEIVTPDSPVALLDHNGALVAGRSVLDAFDRLEVLESTAAAIIRSSPLGTINPMSDDVIKELLEAFPGV